jgi:hypothetical protein
VSSRLPHDYHFCRPICEPFREPFFSKIAIDTPLDTGPERMGEEDPPFHKKQEPAQNLCKNNSWENFFAFFALQFFKITLIFFVGLQKIP